eukprot:scaffold193220_cov37-Prasinocladus_malaysianus.AAC.1
MQPLENLRDPDNCALQAILSICPTEIGIYRSTLVFNFYKTTTEHDRDAKDLCTIEKHITVRCGDSELISELKPATKYAPRSNAISDVPKFCYVPGVSPAEANVVYRIPVPLAWKSNLSARKISAIGSELKRLGSAVSFRSYARYFKLLLTLELDQMEKSIKAFDIFDPGATLNIEQSPCGLTLHRLRVPGLAENRPSVQRGSYVLASKSDSCSNDRQRLWYQGIAHKVELDSVLLAFHPKFDYSEGQEVDIRFTCNHMALRLQRQGLKFMKAVSRQVIFPEAGDPLQPALPRTALFEPQSMLNTEQNNAISNVLQMRPG